MADRVSVTIAIGGALAASQREILANIIADEGLSLEWDGPPFDASQFPDAAPLTLYAHEVAWGRVENLETFCVAQGLPFARWSGSYPGQWDPERVVFTGDGEPQSFGTSEDDYVMIGRHTAEALGSYEAIIANFDAADFAIPPLRIGT